MDHLPDWLHAPCTPSITRDKRRGTKPVTRIRYLDGLRGLACLQVLALHVLSAFFPALVDGPVQAGTLAWIIHHSVLTFLYNGSAGVYIFFYISGYVLTRVYERSTARPTSELAARFCRLWLPTTVFALWSAVLFLAFPIAHQQAGHLFGSAWFTLNWSVSRHPGALASDIFIRPLLLGYRGAPLQYLLPGIGHLLTTSQAALNGPVWTMSVELQGSVLVLILVRVRGTAPRLWTLLLSAAIILLPLQYGPFLVGHFCAVARLDERDWRGWARIMPALGIVAIIIGIIVAAPLQNSRSLIMGPGLIFLGIMINGRCRNLLSAPLLVRVGDFSFTLYLVHWALLFGPAAWLAVHSAPLVGITLARFVGASCVVMAALALAPRLAVLDHAAIALARRIKQPSVPPSKILRPAETSGM